MWQKSGGLSCDGCSNVQIENILWDKCGSTSRLGDLPGGVYFSKVANIVITKCTFSNSVIR